MQNMSGSPLLKVLRQYRSAIVTITGGWMVIIMVTLFAASGGLVGGLPMHMLGATFFGLILVISLLGKTSEQSRPSSPSPEPETPIEEPDVELEVQGLDPRNIRSQYRERTGPPPIAQIENNRGRGNTATDQDQDEVSTDSGEDIDWDELPDLEEL